MPPRRRSGHLVFQGSRLVVISKRGGRDLEIRVAPEHPKLEDYLSFLKVPLTRQFAPAKAIDVETINDGPAIRSPYAAKLSEMFAVTREQKGLRLRRRY